jgi:naphthalene 1,2-dioxygenase system ferredoxin subunit
MGDQWKTIVSVDELIDDDVIGVEVDGKDLAIYSIQGEVYVPDNICTHGLARLSDGFVEDGQIECPLHQGKFCIKTGKALCAPLEIDVQTYPGKVENGQVYAAID